MRDFTFGDRAASSFGLKVGAVHVYNSQAVNVEAFRVPGRIGAVVPKDQPETWENQIREYDVALYLHNVTDREVEQRFSQIRAWLQGEVFSAGEGGYRTLEDSYEPDLYRNAFFSGAFEPQRRGPGQNFSATIQFSCDPRRYRKGVEPVQLFAYNDAETEAEEPTPPMDDGLAYEWKDRPLLKIRGGEAFTLTFLDFYGQNAYGTISIEATADTFFFDLETMEEAGGGGHVVDVSGEPYFVPGNILRRSTITNEVTVYPRFWVR